MSFITGSGDVKRNLLITYVNVAASGASTPEWEAVGVKINDSSIEYNIDVDNGTDILGYAYATPSTIKAQQSLDPFTIRRDSKLAAKLFDIMAVQKDETKLQQFDVMIVYAFAGTDGAFTADKQTGCTIVPKSIGGSVTVDMPIDIYYSNNSTMGTVDKITGPTFTAAVVGG